MGLACSCEFWLFFTLLPANASLTWVQFTSAGRVLSRSISPWASGSSVDTVPTCSWWETSTQPCDLQVIRRTATCQLFLLFPPVDGDFGQDVGPMSTLPKSVSCPPVCVSEVPSSLIFSMLLPFLSSSSVGRRYPRRRSLLCFLLFIILVASTAGLAVSVCCVCVCSSFSLHVYGSHHFTSSASFSLPPGRNVEAGPGIQRNLRLMGAADPPRSVHRGPNHLLDMSENKQPHIQHHVVRRRGEGGRARTARLQEAKRETRSFKRKKNSCAVQPHSISANGNMLCGVFLGA